MYDIAKNLHSKMTNKIMNAIGSELYTGNEECENADEIYSISESAVNDCIWETINQCSALFSFKYQIGLYGMNASDSTASDVNHYWTMIAGFNDLEQATEYRSELSNQYRYGLFVDGRLVQMDF